MFPRQQVNTAPSTLYCTSTHVYTLKFEICQPLERILRHQPYQIVHQQFLQALFLIKQRMKPQLFPAHSIVIQLCLLCNRLNNFMMRYQFPHIVNSHSLHLYPNGNAVEEHVTLFHLIHQQNQSILPFLITVSEPHTLKIQDLIAYLSTLHQIPQK